VCVFVCVNTQKLHTGLTLEQYDKSGMRIFSTTSFEMYMYTMFSDIYGVSVIMAYIFTLKLYDNWGITGEMCPQLCPDPDFLLSEDALKSLLGWIDGCLT